MVSVKLEDREESLLEQGIAQLQELLAPVWEISPSQMATPQPTNLPSSVASDGGTDLVYQIHSSRAGSSARLLVEAKTNVSPLQLREQVAPYLDLMRQLTGDAAVLIIAPYLSPRTRKLLEDLEYGYLDLTGNVFLRLPALGIIIRPRAPSKLPGPLALHGASSSAETRPATSFACLSTSSLPTGRPRSHRPAA